VRILSIKRPSKKQAKEFGKNKRGTQTIKARKTLRARSHAGNLEKIHKPQTP